MIKVNVIINHPKWKNQILDPYGHLKKRVKLIDRKHFKKKINQEFSLLLTNSKIMRNLNSKFLRKKKTTDVLSFPLTFKNKKKLYLGDIAINYEIIKKRSDKSTFLREFDKMWVHGYLHLLGYDHIKLKDFKIMNNKENKIIKSFDY